MWRKWKLKLFSKIQNTVIVSRKAATYCKELLRIYIFDILSFYSISSYNYWRRSRLLLRNPPLTLILSLDLVCYTNHLFIHMLSLVVDSEDDSCAEKGGILVCIAGVVIICIIPQTFGSNTNTLASHLSNNTLYNNLVTWDFAFIFDLLSNGVDNLFRPMLSVSVFILFLIKHSFNNWLHDGLDLGWVEPANDFELD